MIEDVLKFAQDNVELGKKVAVVTITETVGSSPASVGQVLVVAEDGETKGTVGGGASENRVKELAIETMKGEEKVAEFKYDHSESGMVCGGMMKGFVNILGNANHIYIFGGGHVGQSLGLLAKTSGFNVTVIDDRPEFEKDFNDVKYLAIGPDEYEEKINMPSSAYAVICTRGHRTDDWALRYCLGKGLKYIGMIGSAKKVGTLIDQLTADGYKKEDLENLYAPIGIDVASGTPIEIAISILAEILLIKNKGSLNHKRIGNYWA